MVAWISAVSVATVEDGSLSNELAACYSQENTQGSVQRKMVAG